MPREFYIVKGARKVTHKHSDAVAYIYTDKRGRPCAQVFYGKKAKPVAHHWFPTEGERETSVARLFAARQQRGTMMAEHKAERSQAHQLTAGQVLVASWGYDQTNIDYYEVTRIVGARTIEVRKIAAELMNLGDMIGDCLPMAGHYIGEPMIKRANADGRVTIDRMRRARVWEGKANHWTAYA